MNKEACALLADAKLSHELGQFAESHERQPWKTQMEIRWFAKRCGSWAGGSEPK